MLKLLLSAVIGLAFTFNAYPNKCVNCHKSVTPNIVTDWQLSMHSKNEVGCETCHGSEHTGPSNVDKVSLPTPETCKTCHETQVAQFS